MKIFLQIVQLIPALINLIKEIEAVVPQASQGQVKLDAVRGVLQASYDGFEEIWPAVQSTVGVLVKLFNTTGLFNKAP